MVGVIEGTYGVGEGVDGACGDAPSPHDIKLQIASTPTDVARDM